LEAVAPELVAFSPPVVYWREEVPVLQEFLEEAAVGAQVEELA
jgi:hypothetical protein